MSGEDEKANEVVVMTEEEVSVPPGIIRTAVMAVLVDLLSGPELPPDAFAIGVRVQVLHGTDVNLQRNVLKQLVTVLGVRLAELDKQTD